MFPRAWQILRLTYQMNFLETGIVDAWVIDPSLRVDKRGRFFRAWCAREFLEHGLHFMPLQSNLGYSLAKGTLRGMHYQDATAAEAKLVRCTRGAMFDVVLDLRPNSPTFGEWYGVELLTSRPNMYHGCAYAA